MNNRFKFIVPLVLFALTIGFTVDNKYDNAAGLLFLMFVYLVFFIVFKRDDLSEEGENTDNTSISIKANISKTPYLIYYGDELNFTEEELINILTKRFSYFNSLSQIQKARFLDRLQNFIANKTFKIHDNKGFKEMPVLISAAAIQLTLGLHKYLLPNFEFIHVYPQEFMRVQPSVCLLEGNVSGHAINLSWKHFLEGYEIPDDGQNVGLHELAHALYYQTFVVEENVDKGFRDLYDGFISDGNKAFNSEKLLMAAYILNMRKKTFRNFGQRVLKYFSKNRQK